MPHNKIKVDIIKYLQAPPLQPRVTLRFLSSVPHTAHEEDTQLQNYSQELTKLKLSLVQPSQPCHHSTNTLLFTLILPSTAHWLSRNTCNASQTRRGLQSRFSDDA